MMHKKKLIQKKEMIKLSQNKSEHKNQPFETIEVIIKEINHHHITILHDVDCRDTLRDERVFSQLKSGFLGCDEHVRVSRAYN